MEKYAVIKCDTCEKRGSCPKFLGMCKTASSVPMILTDNSDVVDCEEYEEEPETKK